ncbi:ATP-dependent helicase [Clostridium sp. KNHs216]|uniref:ATP-dependent helicase n=1 Tax=Clostridium sp. KNHs216 TaxID=1550235 RepID=UPI001152389D|nr:ATP-dependent helicase [Clostridium sp. KNHs216]TQI67337.1 DNA helicase-2/ATP-dependent DNA helicase PcrA [Clostridium sp. KNHs216]
MGSGIITLKDSHETIDIEHPFKVNAGPGAGKTTWLINHIQNVVQHSNRLGQVKKIACITYTNVAAEKILLNLGEACENVEIGTIHAFLYKHVVKPYVSFLGIPELAVDRIKGHDEYVPNKSILYSVKAETKQTYLDDKNLLEALLDLQWKFDKSGILQVMPRKIFKFRIKRETYLVYKKICWSKGILHHDDVLYFSWRLISEYPSILEILRAKFPYIFVDEFQDTNPIQAEILKKLAEKESIIGVIGDRAQSIYKFQGADVTQFTNFNINGMVEYKIEGNHRSTAEIINILNIVRNDPTLTQYSPENRHGCQPRIMVGDVMATYQQAKRICGKEALWTLCYKNVTSNCLKKGYNAIDEDIMLEDIIANDSNSARAKQLFYIISSIENSRDNKVKDALKLMKRAMRNEDADQAALVQLQYFLDNYELFKDKTLTEFYTTYLDNKAFHKSKITTGKPKVFYDSKKYSDMALTVRIENDDCINRTIHKAKGDENNCVMVIVSEIDDANQGLDFILNPNIASENNRVYYVALSRAGEKLFISVPKIDSKIKDKLIKAGFEIINCS